MVRSRLTLAALLLTAAGPLLAHCDGVDGPVVKAAQSALERGDVKPVLAWVQSSDEAEIRKVFADVVAVRKLGGPAKDLADRHFFETLVRIHRAGEGAPYTGLKPAGRDLGPAIPAADKAIHNGELEPLKKLLADEMDKGLHQRFHNVVAKKDYRADDAAAGREYVKAYVEFVHYVERLHGATGSAASGSTSEHEH